MSKLSILHISDSHWSEASSHYQTQIVSALIKDLQRLSTEKGVRPDAIVFSGDLVLAGEVKDHFYQAYQEILEPIRDYLDIPQSNIFLCPGNHDINRKGVREIDALENGLRGKLISEEAVNAFTREALHGELQALLAVQRMEHYDSFVEETFPPDHSIGTFCRVYHRTISGYSVAFASFNSAWRATGEADGRDDKKLLLGTEVVETIERQIESADIRIATFHHPLEYHATFERVITDGRLARSFDLICNGHTHLPAPQGVNTMHGSCIHSQVGSLFAGTKWHNGYQVIQIDVPAQESRVYAREYSRTLDKFSAASNLIEADPLTLSFQKKSGGLEGEIAVFLNGNRDELCTKFAEHVDFSNDEDLTPTQMISRYEPPPLYEKSEQEIDNSNSIVPRFEKVELNSILSDNESYFFYASRQGGKTSLRHYIAYCYSHGKGTTLKIPVTLDSRYFKFNLYDLVRQLKKQYQFSNNFNIESHVSNGSFVFIFDDCGDASDETLEKIKAFDKNYSPCQTLVFASPNEATFSRERHYHRILDDFKAVGIGELRRGAIRRMARSWFPAVSDANAAFDLVMAQIARDGLPRTAYIVGLLLWAAKKGQVGDRINEAILLQNLLDHLLSKADFTRAKRGSFTTRGRELLLGEMAAHLKNNQGRYADLVTLVERYFNRKQLKHDPGQVVDELVKCGILSRQDGIVRFRFLCFQEFYSALSMTNPRERDKNLAGSNFLNFRREVELLAGIEGQNDELIDHVLTVLDKKMPRDLESVAYSDFESQVYQVRNSFVTRDKVKKIRNTRLSEEQLDHVMDALDDRAVSRGDRRVSESLRDADGDLAKVAEARQIDAIAADLESDAEYFRPGTYIAGISLLSRIIRNSDYTDYDIKGDALEKILDRWCRIHILMLNEVRWILGKMEDQEHENDRLGEKDFEILVSLVSKVLFGATASALVEDLSTPALGKTILQLSEEGRLVGGKGLLGDILLEDCDEDGWDQSWSRKINDKNTPAFEIDVLIDRLWRSVNRKALDINQEKRVDVVLDAVDGRFNWGKNQKSNVVQEIRGIRIRKRLSDK